MRKLLARGMAGSVAAAVTGAVWWLAEGFRSAAEAERFPICLEHGEFRPVHLCDHCSVADYD